MREELTAERARELLDYGPETGVLTWKWREEGPTQWNTRFAGRPAGCLHRPKGRRPSRFSIRLDGKTYLAHRVIWLLVTGKWPDTIDHIDGDSSNNQWYNLRSVSNGDNHKNLPVPASNRSGVIGVSWHAQCNSWQAHISVNGRGTRLGNFKSVEEAAAARKAAEQKYGYHQNHGRK